MAARESQENPFLQGNFGPWRLEGDAPDLEVVEGKIPEGLVGTYVKNGPNPAYEPKGRYHWFDGDGMIHRIRFEGGRAHYRNRWVKGQGLLEEREAGQAIYPGILSIRPSEGVMIKNTANTNVVAHAGKLLALVESSLPTELAMDTLETVGLHDFGGKLFGAMTAHPKMDPVTGEMLFFGYSPFPPYLQFHVADRAGNLVKSEPIDVEWPSMMHDFAITERHVVFLLHPIVFSLEEAESRGSLFSWQPERGTRIGIMPRDGKSEDVVWIETDPCFVFHPLNAYDDRGEIVLDVARYEELQFMAPAAARTPNWRDDNSAKLHRWRLDPAARTLRAESIDSADGEFPRVDDRLVGRKHRYGYMAMTGPEGNPTLHPVFSAIARYDLETGKRRLRAFGAGNGSSEPVFVPRSPGAAEDDGWVLALVYDSQRNASDLWVLDARAIDGDPVARIALPHRVPYGFHGNWVGA